MVRKSDCGIGSVHVLPSRATRPIGVDAQVLLVNLNFHVIPHVGDHGKGRKACVPPALGIERRDSDQAVDSNLAAQVAIGVIAADCEGDPFDAGFLAVLCVEQLHLVAPLFGPAQIHSQQHLGPVTGLGPAGPGVDRDNRVAGVVVSAEHPPQLGIVEPLLEFANFAIGLGRGVAVARFVGELEQNLGVGEKRLGVDKERDLALESALLAQQLLRALAIVPQRRIAGVFIELA